MPKQPARAFTLIELLVVISIIALLIAILLPALSSARKNAQMLENGTRLRGIHQGLVISAQDNKGFYVGWNGKGFSDATDNLSDTPGSTVQARYALLIGSDYVTPEYLVSPGETDTKVQIYRPAAGLFTQSHYSFGLLTITTSGGLNTSTHRRSEWRDTMNSRSVIVADRLLSIPANWNDARTYSSFWSDRPGTGSWYTAWNDNHIEAANSVFIEDTQYGKVTNTVDNLYDRRVGTAQWGNTQNAYGAAVGNDNPGSGTCKIGATNNDANIKTH